MNSESGSPLDDAETADVDPDSKVDRVASRLLAHWGSILLTASVIAAVGLAACLFVLQYRPDRQIDDAAAQIMCSGRSLHESRALGRNSLPV